MLTVVKEPYTSSEYKSTNQTPQNTYALKTAQGPSTYISILFTGFAKLSVYK